MGLTPLHTRILANTSTSPASSPTLEQQLYFLTTLCQPSLPLWSQPSLRSGALFLGQLGLGHFCLFPYIPRGRGQVLISAVAKHLSHLLSHPPSGPWGFALYCHHVSMGLFLPLKSLLSLNISLHPFRGPGQRGCLIHILPLAGRGLCHLIDLLCLSTQVPPRWPW